MAWTAAVQSFSRLTLCGAVLVATTIAALLLCCFYESLLRPTLRIPFSWSRHDTAFWALVLTVAMCFVASTPFTNSSQFDVRERQIPPQWTARELLPSQSTGFFPSHTGSDQHSSALLSLPTASKSALEPKLLEMPVDAAEMEAILSAGVPAEFKSFSASQTALEDRKAVDVQYSGEAATKNLFDTFEAVLDTALVASIRSQRPLPMFSYVIAEAHHWSTLLWRRLPLASPAWSTSHVGSACNPRNSVFDPQIGVMAPAIKFFPTRHSVPGLSLSGHRITYSSPLSHLLPPLKLQLLSRFGFMPYFGSTAVAAYAPSAVTRHVTVQASTDGTDLPNIDSRQTKRSCNSLCKGVSSRLSGPAPYAEQLVCKYCYAEYHLSSLTEETWRSTFDDLPHRMRQQLQGWWQSSTNALVPFHMRAPSNSTADSISNICSANLLNASHDVYRHSESNLLCACAVCSFL